MSFLLGSKKRKLKRAPDRKPGARLRLRRTIVLSQATEGNITYLVHAHDPVAVLAANYLESIGQTRHIVGPQTTVSADMVALISGDSGLLKRKFIRKLRPDNEDTLGMTIPEWAKGAREVIVINRARASETNALQEVLRQLNSRITEVPLRKKKRRSRNRAARDSSRGLSIMG